MHRSRESIRTSQLDQLRSLVAELIPGNRFYSRKLADAGLTFDVASLKDFSRRFPFTIKSELVSDQQVSPPFGTNLTYPLDRYQRFHQTSGTTGSPLRWLDTRESWEWLLELWNDIYDAAGVSSVDHIYFAFSFGPFLGFWTAFEAANRLGALCLPGGGLSSVARVNAILENQATVVCCTPTYALRLAETAAEHQINLSRSKARTFIVAGEPGGSLPALRQRFEQLWPGARMFDHHGMTEVGPVTYECPTRPGVLHVIETGHLAEIVNPVTGSPASEGECGELILTPLGRTGSPLIRYRTGDLVQKEERPVAEGYLPCSCGRFELALPGGILGRTDDMIVVRGVNVYPSAVEEIVRQQAEVVEFRVNVAEIHSLVELSVDIELTGGQTDAAAVAHKLAKDFQTHFALRIPVQVVETGSLPKFEMKSRRWVREKQN